MKRVIESVVEMLVTFGVIGVEIVVWRCTRPVDPRQTKAGRREREERLREKERLARLSIEGTNRAAAAHLQRLADDARHGRVIR